MEAGILVRQLSRKPVFLPVLKIWGEVRAVTGAEMLEEGIMPLIRSGETPTEEDIKHLRKQAQKIAIACFIHPFAIVEKETDKPKEVCVKDLDDADLFSIYAGAVQLSDSRYYGTNRTALSIEDDAQAILIDRQANFAANVDMIARRYGLNPLDVLRFTSSELALINSLMDCGDSKLEADMKAKAEQAAKGGA